ncbi:DUF4245 domain-containing protein [Nakamurella endophytica]|uniref:DUF4245 domain-containing protein n=1 Tax=Nakamurella endophytica TaxID=1748367 RepID=A0A917WBF6_9ACTN|nr:DUF4245 domain-containing protein [Nakamurella endophytica]GGL86913.1 hypothetical protein GCM10011594_03180 [Nakamurella endophytica]
MAGRRNKTLRDMLLSMAVILVGVFVIALFQGGVSFAPGGVSGGSVPSADIGTGFANAQAVVGFPVVAPRNIPSGWQGNSFTTTPPGGAGAAPAAVRAGWVTPSGAFVTLIESAGAPDAVQRAELGVAGSATGSIDAGGATWTVVPGRRSEMAWIRTTGGLTYLITGSASGTDFTTVAESVAG